MLCLLEAKKSYHVVALLGIIVGTIVFEIIPRTTVLTCFARDREHSILFAVVVGQRPLASGLAQLLRETIGQVLPSPHNTVHM